MTRRLALAAVAVAGLIACGDLFAPPISAALLAVRPEFGANAVFANDADLLRVRIYRDSTGSPTGFETAPRIDDTLQIVDGQASGTLSLPILHSPQTVWVQLDAIRSLDGLVLFSGSDTASVRASTSGEPSAPVSIPVLWVGPKAASLVVSPSDTALEAGATFTYRSTVIDSLDATIDVPVRYRLLNPPDSTLLVVDRLTGAVVAAAAAVQGDVRILAQTPDSLARDTARVLIGAAPVGVRVTPGYANVATGGTTQIMGAVVDAIGDPLSGFPLDWTSRTGAVATVDGSGLVTGVAPGTAIIVATASTLPGAGFIDSALVTVPAAGEVVVSTTSSDRAFRRTQVGDTVVVDVTADISFTASELLGSYNAILTWDAAVLSFVDVQPGDFAAPELNTANVSTGELRFAQADANGVGGAVVVARVRFVAAAAGQAAATVVITEMSAARTFTNLIGSVIVTNGIVTVQ